MKRYLIKPQLLLAIFLMAQVSFSQQITLSGIITDEQKESIIGVTVVQVGTTNGVISDYDGKYSIVVPTGSNVEFSFVGYQAKRIKATTSGTYNIRLSTEQIMLNDVQIVAYGQKKRREVTGSIQNIKGEDLTINSGANVATAIQGRASGVQITSSAGDRDVRIRIRGVSSLKSSSEPLIVVDGAISENALSEINSDDILSLEILKDASATVLYGARAANGVILITTKQGSELKSTLNISINSGVSTPSSRNVQMLDGPGYLNALNQAWQNRYPGSTVKPTIVSNGYDGFYAYNVYDGGGNLIHPASNYNTNWMDYVYDNGVYNKINLSTSGGTKKTKYYLSGMYRHDDGYMGDSDYNRLNSRLKVDHKINEKVEIGINLSANIDKQMAFSAAGGWKESQTSALPVFPVFSPSNSDKYWYDYEEANQNFLVNRTYKSNHSTANRFLNIVHLAYKPIKDLTLRTEWSNTYNMSEAGDYSAPYILPANQGEPFSTGYGKMRVLKSERLGYMGNNIVSYTKKFGNNHSTSYMIGNTIERYNQGSLSVFQEGMPNDQYLNSNTINGGMERVTSSYTEYRYLAGMGRFSYGFMNRYFAELSYRRDGSSRFGYDRRWGSFKGGSLGWLFSDEQFVKNLLPIIYTGKIRLSYGEIGNDATGDNFRYIGKTLPWFTYGGNSGVIFQNVANSALRWETTRDFNVGMDLSFNKGRIITNIDFFNKISDSLLLDTRIGTFHGFWENNIESNIGSLQWRGLEFSVTSVNIEGLNGKFNWKTEFNITYMQSKILRLASKSFEAGTNRVIEGAPLGTYYLVEWAGVDPVTGHELIYEVDPIAYEKYKDGALLEEHLTGNILDAETLERTDQHRVLQKDKSPYPDFYGGLGNTFNYKNVEFSFLFYFQYGNWIYDNAAKSKAYISASQNGALMLNEGWTAEKPTNIPLLYDSRVSSLNSTRYLYDGSYIRLRNVRLGYTLPSKLTKVASIKSAKVYFTVSNVFILTKYPGVDPEASYSYSANLNPGVLDFNLPQARTFLMGLDITF